MCTIKEVNHNGFIVRVVVDFNPCNPREEYCLGQIIAEKGSVLQDHAWMCLQDAEADLDDCMNDVIPEGSVVLHISDTLRVTEHADARRIGVIFASPKGMKECGLSDVEAVKKNLRSEIETLKQWMEGDVFGWQILKRCGTCNSIELMDSCYGYYDVDEAMLEGMSAIEGLSVPSSQNIEKAEVMDNSFNITGNGHATLLEISRKVWRSMDASNFAGIATFLKEVNGQLRSLADGNHFSREWADGHPLMLILLDKLHQLADAGMIENEKTMKAYGQVSDFLSRNNAL